MGAGAYLLYAAYRNESPWARFTSVIGVAATAPSTTPLDSTASTSSTGPGPTLANPTNTDTTVY